MISFFVRGQALKISQPLVVSDTIDYLEAAFIFQTSDWDGLSKWAHFSQGEKVYDIMLTDDKIRREDHLNLSAGDWVVYLHGNSADGMRITTEEMKLTVKKTGLLKGQPLPEVPVSAAEQIAAQAQRAENIAQSVRDDADAGKFKGEKGERGPEGFVGPMGERGPAGPAGSNGKDGKTPVKGVDYFTPAELQDVAKEAAKLVEPGGGSGVTKEMAMALDNMLKVCAYIKPDVSAEYNAFRAAFGLSTLVPATKVNISQANLELTSVEPVTLTASVEPPDSTDTVTWESKNTNVATVDQNGKVTPVNNGSATIKAIAGKVYAVCNVKVNIKDIKTFTITNKLTGCRNSNNTLEVVENSPYNATITANEGYTMDGAKATIMMGGSDVTQDAYSNGTITIPKVTGNIEITVSAAIPVSGQPFGVQWEDGWLAGGVVSPDFKNRVTSDFIDVTGKKKVTFNVGGLKKAGTWIFTTSEYDEGKVYTEGENTGYACVSNPAFPPLLELSITEGTKYIRVATFAEVSGVPYTDVEYDLA